MSAVPTIIETEIPPDTRGLSLESTFTPILTQYGDYALVLPKASKIAGTGVDRTRESLVSLRRFLRSLDCDYLIGLYYQGRRIIAYMARFSADNPDDPDGMWLRVDIDSILERLKAGETVKVQVENA